MASKNYLAQLVALFKSGGGAASTITGPLDRKADAASVSTALSTEDVALLTALNTILGVTSGAAVITDANGTAQQYLRGLVKLWIAGLAAGEAHIGEVSGNSAAVQVALTVSTSPAYSSGDSIGGKITIANAARAAGRSTTLQNMTVLDRANQSPAGTILIFNADPVNATITDNAAFVYSTDDLKVVARIPVAASDYVTINSKSIAGLPNLGRVLGAPASGTSLFAAFVTTSTPTFAATTDVQVTFGLMRD